MQLDNLTMLVMLCLLSCGFAVAQLLIWRFVLQSRSLLLWGLGFGAYGAGVLMIAGRGFIPDFISFDIANVLIVACYGLLWAGVSEYRGEAPHTRTILAALFLSAIIYAWFVHIDPNIAARIIIVRVFYLFYIAKAIQSLLNSDDDKLPFMEKTAIAALSFEMVLHLAVAVTQLLNLSHLEPIHRNMISSFSFMLAPMGLIAWGLSLIMLIIERKSIELQKSEEQMRVIFETADSGIFLTTSQGTIEFANRRMAEMFGLPLQKMIGTTYPEYLNDNDRPIGTENLRRLIRGEFASTTVERNFARKDGKTFWGYVSASRVENPDGSLQAIVVVVTDVTASKNAEDSLRRSEENRILQLEDANEKIEAAYSAKSAFLANMSHELRTPLNAIIGFSEVLQDHLYGPLNAKQEQYVADILDGGRHLLSLINDVLDLSKVESGVMELKLAPANLARLCQSTLTMFQEKAQKLGIALSCSVGAAGDTEMLADGRMVKQILFNLVDNAIKFNQQGGAVSVGLDRVCLAAGEYWRIIVEDTGIGIAAADIAKLFQPFRQLESTYVKIYHGTGLGLALTKRMVELHGGEIRVESEPGKGSRFIVLIPVR